MKNKNKEGRREVSPFFVFVLVLHLKIPCGNLLIVSRRDSGQPEMASDLPNGRPERELIHYENIFLGLIVALRLVFS